MNERARQLAEKAAKLQSDADNVVEWNQSDADFRKHLRKTADSYALTAIALALTEKR